MFLCWDAFPWRAHFIQAVQIVSHVVQLIWQNFLTKNPNTHHFQANPSHKNWKALKTYPSLIFLQQTANNWMNALCLFLTWKQTISNIVCFKEPINVLRSSFRPLRNPIVVATLSYPLNMCRLSRKRNFCKCYRGLSLCLDKQCFENICR